MSLALYAAGTATKKSTEIKRKINYDQLLSQLNERSSCDDWVKYKREHPECKSKLFIDSGAFTAHTKGKEVDVDDYIQYINSIDDQVTTFAQVDHIPGVWGKPKTPEQLAEAPKLSWENYLYMVDKVKSAKKLQPIFHQGEDFKYLIQMVNYKYDENVLDKSIVGQPIDYIGLSCNKELSTTEWVDWFTKCFKIIHESSNPNVKTHAFGMTSLKVLEQFPFTSADSTSWIRSASFGNVILNYGSVYVSSWNKNDPSYILNQSKAIQEEVAKKCNKYNMSFFELLDEATTEDRDVVLEKITSLANKTKKALGKVNIVFEIPEYTNKYIIDIKEELTKNVKIAVDEYLETCADESLKEVVQNTYEIFNVKLNGGEFNGKKEKGINAPAGIRADFNLYSLKEWVDNYKYIGTTYYENDLW